MPSIGGAYCLAGAPHPPFRSLGSQRPFSRRKPQKNPRQPMRHAVGDWWGAGGRGAPVVETRPVAAARPPNRVWRPNTLAGLDSNTGMDNCEWLTRRSSFNGLEMHLKGGGSSRCGLVPESLTMRPRPILHAVGWSWWWTKPESGRLTFRDQAECSVGLGGKDHTCELHATSWFALEG